MKINRSKIFKELKSRINKGQYKQGATMVEKEICKEFGISRTPYRETLMLLENENLVEIHPKKGVVVTSIDLKSLRDTFEMRAILERAAVELACKRIQPCHLEVLKKIVSNIDSISMDDYESYQKIDKAFHEIFHEAHGNELMREFLSRVHDKCIRVWNLIEGREDEIKEMRVEAIKALKKVYEAFASNDQKGVAEGMKEHFGAYLHKITSLLIGDMDYNS